MRRPLRVTVVVLLCALLCLGGPRARVGTPDLDGARAAVPTDPAALELWLEGREAPTRDVVRGAEKRIQWASGRGRKSAVALVYVHGFSASPQEIEPVMGHLGRTLDANVFWTRLRGHGRDGRALARVSAADWLEDTAEAVQIGRTIADEVVLVGTSTGATLAALYALENPDDPIAGLVLLSPNLGPKAKAAELLRLPWLSVLLPPLLGQRQWAPRNEEHERYWTTRYPHKALVPMMALVQAARVADWSRLKAPVVVFANPDDPVVDGARVSAWEASLPEDLLTRQDWKVGPGEDGHVLAGDILAPEGTLRLETAMAIAIATF